MELLDPTDIKDANRGVDGGDEFIESVKPVDRSIDDDTIDPAADDFLADLGTNGSISGRIPFMLPLQ
jgi:hypothetical protein